MNVIITRTINILLPNNRSIKVESPYISEDEFNYFIEILNMQKQGLVVETQESDEVVEEVCEWAYSRDNHPNITYKSTHEIDLYIPMHTKDTIDYCPSCGKRIKYVESEE